MWLGACLGSGAFTGNGENSAALQQDILENQTQLISYASAALGAAILIELVFALIAIIRRRGIRKNRRMTEEQLFS